MDTTNTKMALLGVKAERLAVILIYCALAVIYFWFGGMKFTAYEAEGLVGLVSNSPVLSWVYDIASHQGFSNALGFLEILIGSLILARIINPALSALGGVLSMGLFATTLTFMVSTPGVFEAQVGGFPGISVMPGQFLLKDVGLLAASAFVLGNSLKALSLKA